MKKEKEKKTRYKSSISLTHWVSIFLFSSQLLKPVNPLPSFAVHLNGSIIHLPSNMNQTQELDSSSESRQQNEIDSLEDLLALESVRWLQVGRQGQMSNKTELPSSTHRSAPYEKSLNISKSIETQAENRSAVLNHPAFLSAPIMTRYHDTRLTPPHFIWPYLIPMISVQPNLTLTSLEPNLKEPYESSLSNKTYEQKQTISFNRSSGSNELNFPSLKGLEIENSSGHTNLSYGDNTSSPIMKNWTTDPMIRVKLGQQLDSSLATNKTMVKLLCDTDNMVVQINFRDPFYGQIQTDLDPVATCFFLGRGNKFIEWRIGLRDCGTRQEDQNIFINNLKIQFEDSESSKNQSNLRTVKEEEIKTIVCSYPLKPVAPPPRDFVTKLITERNRSGRIIDRLEPTQPALLVEYEPLALLAGIFFILLAILALGLGTMLLVQRLRVNKINKSRSRFDSKRFYPRSPAQTANQGLTEIMARPNKDFLMPPLLSWAKTDESPSWQSRVRVPRWDTTDRSKTPNRVAIGQSITRNKPTSRVKQPPRKDSLGESSSVTMIDIPYNLGKEKDKDSFEQIVTPKSQVIFGPSNSAEKSEIKTVPLSVPINENILKMSSNEKFIDIDKNLKDEKVSGDHLSIDQQDHHSTKLGSIRRTLTSPSEYRRLKWIEDIFSEDGDSSFSADDKRFIARKALKQMDMKDRILISDKLKKDELFRSDIIQSRDRETFDRKLRSKTFHGLDLRPESWNIFENLVVDGEQNETISLADNISFKEEPVARNDNKTSYLTGLIEVNKEEKKKKKKPQEPGDEISISNNNDGHESIISEISAENVHSIKSNSESELVNKHRRKTKLNIREVPVNFRSRISDKSASKEASNCDSLEESVKSSGSETENTFLARSRQDDLNKELDKRAFEGHSRSNRSLYNIDKEANLVDRVNQFEIEQRQRAGLSGTLIEFDSITNITSSDNFTTYTRSSIEHRRFEDGYMYQDGSQSSSPPSMKFVDTDSQ